MAYRSALSLVLAAATAASAGDLPRVSRLEFASRVEVVNLSLSVVDGREAYVTDLTLRDLLVLENGRPQELALFTCGTLPISLSIIVDVSASMHARLAEAQAAAQRLARTLGPDDRAQVVQFHDRVEVLQEFTGDQEAIGAAIEATELGEATALYDAVYIALKSLRKAVDPDERRRRAIVLLSDGSDTASLTSDDQVLELARKSDVTIYTIALRSPMMGEELDKRNQAVHFLTALARETGGRTYAPLHVSDLDGVYDRIAEELRKQYSVGYVSSNPPGDRKWRRIVVLTPTRAGLQLRHRTGYYPAR